MLTEIQYSTNGLTTTLAPDKLELELTRSCAQKCEHCSVFGAPMSYKNDVPKEVLLRVIDEFSDIGGARLVITGGEPFERGSDFVLDLVARGESRGLSTSLYTSGYPIDPRLAEELAISGLSIACVSLEGSKDIHEKITRVTGSYDYAIKAIRLLADSGITVVVHYTAMAPNIRDIMHVATTAEKNGASSLKIINFIPQGRGSRNRTFLSPDGKSSAQLQHLIESLKRKSKLKIEFGGQFQRGKTDCSIGRRITITCTGDVIPCLGVRWDKSYILGNIKSSSLGTIWENSRFRQIRHQNDCICASIWG